MPLFRQSNAIIPTPTLRQENPNPPPFSKDARILKQKGKKNVGGGVVTIYDDYEQVVCRPWPEA